MYIEKKIIIIITKYYIEEISLKKKISCIIQRLFFLFLFKKFIIIGIIIEIIYSNIKLRFINNK